MSLFELLWTSPRWSSCDSKSKGGPSKCRTQIVKSFKAIQSVIKSIKRDRILIRVLFARSESSVIVLVLLTKEMFWHPFKFLLSIISREFSSVYSKRSKSESWKIFFIFKWKFNCNRINILVPLYICLAWAFSDQTRTNLLFYYVAYTNWINSPSKCELLFFFFQLPNSKS